MMSTVLSRFVSTQVSRSPRAEQSSVVQRWCALVCAVSALAGCATQNASPLPLGDGGIFGPGTTTASNGGGAAAPSCQPGAEFGCGGSPSSGGVTSSGSGSSGAGSTTGNSAGGNSDLGEGVTISICEGAHPPNIPPASFPSCAPIAGCGVSRCVPIGALPKADPSIHTQGVPADLLQKCGDGNSVCVPDEYIKTYGEFLPKTCKSLGGVEGRCISTCVPQVNGLMDALPKDVCGDAERCAPCYNPNDGSDTQACRQGCDTGPSAETTADKDKHVFETCQTDGRCVPKEIVPPPLASRLVQTTCSDPDAVCAPVVKSQNLKYNFASCVPGSFSAVTGAPNADAQCNITQYGGCIPKWIMDLSNPLEEMFMAQTTCPDGYLCAPCHDPLLPDPTNPSGQTPTGACPTPLPTDPSGGLPPDGAGGVAGVGGAPVQAIGCTKTAGADAGPIGSGGSGGGP